jgi:putative addiction module component (TIGR02574 family)
MNARVDQLLADALDLPADERSALVVALLDSLEGSTDAAISEAWRKELRLRKQALREGTLKAVPWAEARARLSAL